MSKLLRDFLRLPKKDLHCSLFVLHSFYDLYRNVQLLKSLFIETLKHLVEASWRQSAYGTTYMFLKPSLYIEVFNVCVFMGQVLLIFLLTILNRFTTGFRLVGWSIK